MKLIKTPFGVFSIKEGELKDKRTFKDPEKALKSFLSGEMDEEITKLKEKYPEAELECPTEYITIGKRVLGKDLNKFLNKFFRELSRRSISRGFSEDLLVKQAIRALDEVEEMSNKIFERTREWFNLFYPEAADKLDDMEKFFNTIESMDRGEISDSLKIDELSMGADFSAKDKEVLFNLIEAGKKLNERKKEIRGYVKKKMSEIAPNLTAIAGPEIGAQLISIAGSLEKLAKEPSSTIQVLGAEEALFQHLKKGTPSPKYGVLFKHPMVKKVKDENRGKMARTLASKIAIAARTDYYSDREIHKDLKEDLKKRRDRLC